MNNKIIQNQNIIKLAGLLLLAILLCTPMFFQASPEGISGKLVYEDKTVVDDAVVSILDIEDRSLITSGLTGVDGTFKFDQMEEGSYFISIQVLDQPHKVYGPIHISADQTKLVIKTLVLPVPPAKKKIAMTSTDIELSTNI